MHDKRKEKNYCDGLCQVISVKEYSKPLKKSEARHRYWQVIKDDRDFFPESGEIFKIEFHGKTYELNVNHKNDIMTGKLYDVYRFLEGDRIILKKKSRNVYVLKAPDTKPYPKVG